ncbi:FimV family protein [Alicycliphilus denitrificans]|uniref:type IV pilus assembly protein FimV n=1 Tax=Alicycliphilus denitrificans TaxID=179636 RepID=UPI003850796D
MVLGAPIDLMFEVRPDPGQDLASSCLSARLVSGANTISEARTQVTPILGGSTPMVRVQTRVAADEPVLTVTLAAGCEGRVTRTYTFLADPPAGVPANAGTPMDIATFGAAAAPVASGVARPRGASADMPAMGGEERPAAAASPRLQARASLPRVPEQPARARVRAPVPTPAAAAPARLLVEPLDLWLDTPLTLRLARDEPLRLSAPDEAKRAEFAALWKAFRATPEDLKQAMEHLDKLQGDAKAQGKQVETERATVAELRQRLQQVEQERFSASWVYGLGALLALAVGGMAWLLRRTRREELQAWQHSVALSAGSKDGALGPEKPDALSQWRLEPEASDTWPHSILPAEASLTGQMPMDAPDTVPVVPTAPAAMEAGTPAQKTVRMGQIVPPEALFDIQQQAEFFISIGEHEQAIEVLRAHINEHGDAMPWAYLESLRLFHMLGRTEAFNRMREQFQERFNVRVPGFGQFQLGGQTLEDYPQALAQIEALWTSPEVLALLDGFLVRRDQEHQAERFDLAAFDDLLLLLAIVQTTPAHLRGAPPPRARTTPMVAGVTLAAEPRPDSIAGDLSLLPSGYDVLTPQTASEATLDVDLSQLRMPDIALGGHPDMAAPTAQAAGAGFALENDKLELHFELEQMDKKRF